MTSFRDAENYGQFTTKQLESLRLSRKTFTPNTIYNHPPFTQKVIRLIINVVFFTIPWTYLAHIKVSSEYRGRLSGVQQNWQTYIERLVREYSDFLLVVSWFIFHAVLLYLIIFQQSTVLLS